jgi:hypothetical protein
MDHAVFVGMGERIGNLHPIPNDRIRRESVGP